MQDMKIITENIREIEDIKETIESFACNISNGVENGEYVRYIGIREMGVDSNTFIHSKIDNQGCWNFKDGDFQGYYKNLFRVTITEGSNEYTGRRIIKIVTDEIGLK